MTDPWRIQPTTPPSLAVLVDAWEEVQILAPFTNRGRVDLIAERVHGADGGREIRVFYSGLDIPPPLPPGFAPIAMVRVPRGAFVIHAAMIS